MSIAGTLRARPVDVPVHGRGRTRSSPEVVVTALLGIDLGTSSVKALLVGERDNVLAEASASLTVSRPRPLWSEQDPDDWWRATEAALDRLATSRPQMLADVTGIGLSGQMLGVTLL